MSELMAREKAFRRRDELQKRYERHLAGTHGFGRSDDILDDENLRDLCDRISALDDYLATLDPLDDEAHYAPC